MTRRNKTDEAGVATKKASAGARVKPPAEDRSWHPVIKAWFRSLKQSGQSKFYEASDWQAARLTAFYASKVIKDAEDEGKPLRAASMDQIWKMMADLMTTETARRRARVELVRAADGPAEDKSAEVIDIGRFAQDYG